MRKKKILPNSVVDEVVVTRRERKKLNCKYAIIHAAQDNFEEKGIEGTSINDITAAADISYATFFNYFPSKESLLISIYLEELVDLKEFIAVKLRDETSAIKKLRELFCEWLKDGLTYKRTSLRVHEVSSLNADTDTLKDSIQNLFIAFIDEGQKSGEVRGDLSALHIAMVLEGLYYSILTHHTMPKKEINTLLDVYFNSLKAK